MQKKNNNPSENSYNKRSLPKITYVNLDGYVDSIYTNILK